VLFKPFPCKGHLLHYAALPFAKASELEAAPDKIRIGNLEWLHEIHSPSLLSILQNGVLSGEYIG